MQFEFEFDFEWNQNKLLIRNNFNENLNYYLYGVFFSKKIFIVQSIWVHKNLRGKKISIKLFYNLCILLYKKIGSLNTYIVLDDCSGTSYNNNLYSKLDFLVLNSKNRWTTIKNYEIQNNLNPNEKRRIFAYKLYLKTKSLLI